MIGMMMNGRMILKRRLILNVQFRKIIFHPLVTSWVCIFVFTDEMIVTGIILTTGFNGTVKNKRTLNTGKNDISQKGLFVSYQDQVINGNWSDEKCNMVRGRDPGTLTIGLDKHTPLDLYFSNMCRNIKFVYRKTVVHGGISTYRYVPEETTFHSPRDNPDNSCYCHDRLCLPSGIFDIGIGCKVSK